MFKFLQLHPLAKKIIVATLAVIGALFLAITFLPHFSFLEYYINGIGLKAPVLYTSSRVVLWSTPQQLSGELNEFTGNLDATVSSDHKMMIVTRYYGDDNRDLFISRNVDGKWTKPIRIKNINSEYNDITPSLSDDGKILFFASDRPGGKGGFDIWISRYVDDQWTAPYLISNGVNTEYDEINPYLSDDRQAFYFNSNRPEVALDNPRLDSTDDYFDIFSLFVDEIIENEDGSIFLDFKSLKRLNNLNSKYDEGRVTATARGNIVYFSSNRRGGYGGYDIYRSYLLPEGYTKPENLGNIINSPENEISADISTDGYEIYYCSNKLSWDKVDYSVYKSDSMEVTSKFDYMLLFELLVIVLLLLIIAIIIWLLLRMLARRTDMSLIVKCLILALLVHILLALLSGIWYMGSRVSEKLRKKHQDLTININSLARESVALSIREGIASLPKVKAVASTEQPTEKVSVPQQQPVSSSEVSETWRETDLVRPASSPVNVKRAVHSEQAKRFTSDNQEITDVDPIKFGSAEVAMEVPEGTGEQASARTEGKASGLPKVMKPIEIAKENVVIAKINRKPISVEMMPTSLTSNVTTKNINKTLTDSIKPGKISSSPSVQTAMTNQDIDGLYDDISEFAGDDREVDGMMGSEGGFLLDVNYVMFTPSGQSTNQPGNIGLIRFNREFSPQEERKLKEYFVMINPVNLKSTYLKQLLKYGGFAPIFINYKRSFNEPVGELIYDKTPKFLIAVDSEMEVPESYIEDR